MMSLRLQLDQLRATLDETASETVHLRAEREQLLKERDQLRAVHDRLQAEDEQLLTERDRLKAEREQLLTERDQVRGERDHLETERDQLRTEHQQLREDVVFREQRHTAAQHDLTLKLETAQAEHRRLDMELENLRQQLNELRATLGESKIAMATVREERDRLGSECRQLQKDVVIRERLMRRNIEQDIGVMAERLRQYKPAPELARKDVVLTVTAGRSGTRLLAVLLSRVLGIDAQHEPEPRANFWVRPTLENPISGLDWLIEEKLPSIAARPHALYVETSHFFCKGLIEPLLMLGLRPRFIVLRRNPAEVARSFYMLNVIPGRNAEGLLNLTNPSDANSLSLPDWQGYSDYQLCYWYAKDMEQRQTAYLGGFIRNKVPYLELEMTDLLDWNSFLKLCAFVDPTAAERNLSRTVFNEVIAVNQNTRDMANPVGHVDRPIPADVEEQERQIDLACAPKDASTAINLKLPNSPIRTEG